MKNYRKLLKRKLKRFVLAGLVPVLSVCSIVFASFSQVVVKAGLASDPFNDWVAIASGQTGGTNGLPLGTVYFQMGDYSFPLSCDLDFSATIQDLSLGASFIAGATETTSYYFDWRYSYNWDFEDYIMCRIALPASFCGYVVNGVVSTNFTLSNNNIGGGTGSSSSDIAPMFYQSNGVRLSFPSDNYTHFIDETYRYSVSFDSPLPEGLSCSVTPAPSSAGNNVYYLTVNFKDFYVPFIYAGNNFSGLIEIPLKFHYFGNTVYGGQVPNGSSGSPVDATHLPPQISEALVHVTPARASGTISATWRCRLEGAGFYRDNDYYTIIQALSNTQSLNNTSSNIASIQALLSAWVGSSDPSSIPVDFADFATAVLTYLQNNSDVVSPSDLASINNNLASLLASQGREEQAVNNILSKLSDWEISTIQSNVLTGLSSDINDSVDSEHLIYSNFLNQYSSRLGLIMDTYGDIYWEDYGAQAEAFITPLEDFFSSIGPLYLVVSVVLLGGVLLRVLGKVH